MNARMPQHGLARPRLAPLTEAFGRRSVTGRRVKVASRVLFVGFDGVLHPTVFEVEPVRMEKVIGVDLFGWLPVLESLLRPHQDVAVVVHSNWRLTHDDEELQLLLGRLGHRMLGSTTPGARYEGIQQWLRANPACTSHRILDGDAADFPRPLPIELIVCDPDAGVTGNDVIAALRAWLAS